MDEGYLRNLREQVIRIDSDRKVADKRIYPALDITSVRYKKRRTVIRKDELSKMNVLRRIKAHGNDGWNRVLISKLKNTKNNSDFSDSMNKSAN